MNLVPLNRRQACVLAIGASASGWAAAQANPQTPALHMLNRLAYGHAPHRFAVASTFLQPGCRSASRKAKIARYDA